MKNKEFSLQNLFPDADGEALESLALTLIMNDNSRYSHLNRCEYYSNKLKKAGKGLKIGKGVKIVNPEYIEIGDNVTISDDVTIICRGKGGIKIDDNVTLCERVYLDTERAEDGYIHIGKNVYIGTCTTLFGHVGLEIGDHSLLAQNITITPYSHIFDDPDQIIAVQDGHTRRVTIGRDCYIGMGVCVMYSADVGEGSVVGAGSVVVKPIPPYSVAVGNPAKVIKKREKKEVLQESAIQTEENNMDELIIRHGRPITKEMRFIYEMNCYDMLDELGIEFDRIDHAPADNMELCRAIDEALGAEICKNLFLCNRQMTDFYLLMTPGDKPFKTKNLSSQLGVARLSFASEEKMWEYLKIRPGAVSVLGLMNDTDKHVRLIVDKDILNGEYIGCHPCVSTTSLRIKTEDVFGKFIKAVGHEMTVVELPWEND